MKINGLIDNPRWYDIPCKCNHDSVETEYPIAECEHCRCQECWDSVPQQDFTVSTTDKEGHVNGTKKITEITLVRGHDLEDVIGWTF